MKKLLPLVAAVATVFSLAVHVSATGARKAVVYCPVGIDVAGCDNIVAALTESADLFPGGVDRGYDGSSGTVDLATVDLTQYAAFIVPSLADNAETKPYALLRDSTFARRLRELIHGRAAVWSGTPDLGTASRTEKNTLIRNLANWAATTSADGAVTGLVALLDLSSEAASRYNWVTPLAGVRIAPDTTTSSQGAVEALTATGRSVLDNAGSPLAYGSMASFGLTPPASASSASADARGASQGGTPGPVVLITASGTSGSGATVATDKADYAPGQHVTFTGSGWQPGETVTLLLEEDPYTHSDRTLTAVADASGTILNAEFSPEEHHVGVTFYVTAEGQTSGRVAQTRFTDAKIDMSITDVSANEGQSGTTTFTFTVSLASAHDEAVTVDYNTADGTATAPSDYVATSGTLTIPAKATSRTISVTVNGDVTVEGNETFTVRLSRVSPSNAINLAKSQGVGTILNDEIAQTAISITDVSQAEGSSGTTAFTFAVSLSSASSQTVTVNYATADGSATIADGDYAAATGTLTFAAGVVSQQVTVNVTGDTKLEPDETFTVNLTAPTNATIADAQGVGTIVNDDASPVLSIDDVSVAEGNAPATATATFTVTLSPVSGQTATVTYATSDGTATAGTDYAATTGTLTFLAGETTKQISVTVNGDALDEPDETFLVNLSAPTNATIGDGQGQGTITDDDAAPAISINDVSVAEGNAGTTPATFTVALSAASGQTVTVGYATADGTATTAGDYVAATGTVTFLPGETSKDIAVQVSGDPLDEPDETFLVNLSAPTNATIGDGQGQGTIADDDAAPAISINDVSVAEGNAGTTPAIFTVALSAPSGQTVAVSYATANAGATAGSDYVAANGTVTFLPGETSKPIAVQVSGDLSDEPNEAFVVNLSGAVNGTIADGQGEGTIIDDDAAPTLSINDVSVTEGNAGTVAAVFTVTLSAASGNTVRADFATADGSATLVDGDYVAQSGGLTFAPGTTTQTVTVLVNGDTKFEPSETFTVNLSAPTAATIADGQGQGTIVNDDTQPAISISDVSAPEGNSGSTPFAFAVTLSSPSALTVTVRYATANGPAGEAIAPNDYANTSGTLTFAPGTTQQTITVPVVGETRWETDQFFFVNLSVPTNATIADAQAVGDILNDDPEPTIFIDDQTVTEGNSGTVKVGFFLRLSNLSSEDVTVTWTTADGSATAADADYVPNSGTLTVASGTMTKHFDIGVGPTAIPLIVANGDTKFEADETFFVRLSNPTHGTLDRNEAKGTIINDDTPTTISINDVSVTEGNSGTTNATFTVSLSEPSGQSVTVNFATADGTAVAPADYASTTGAITFAAGEVSKSVTVPVNGDLIDEEDETFFVNLSGAGGATIADAQGKGTIIDNDAVAIAIGDVTVTEGTGGSVTATFPVTLSTPSDRAITVDFSTADGTATAGADYTTTAGTLTFAAGQTSKTISVPVISDGVDEPDESFLVSLANATNATIADAQGVGTILDDDVVPVIAIGNVTKAEGNSGSTPFTFMVSLSNPSSQTITVDYATADGSATTADLDYSSASGTLTFAPGVITQVVNVPVVGDMKFELDETFSVNLSGPTNATIGDGTGQGTITNDDAQPIITIDDVSANEGNSGPVQFTFTVSLSSASSQTVTTDFATANGSATTADADYVAATGTVSFAPGVTTQTITIQVNGDMKFEPNEDFFVNLSNPVGAMIADNQGAGSIVNDDVQPTLSINDVSVTEGNSGTTGATFTVSLSNASAQTVTVSYATEDGTATTADGDYAPSNGLLTFTPGQTAQTVTVLVSGDTKFESDETFSLKLSTPANATIADGAGEGTIANDDTQPTVSISDVSANEGNVGPTSFTFAVTLSSPSSQPITVSYTTADGSATIADADYTAATGTVTFVPGATSELVTVSVNGDTRFELAETFTVNLSAPTNATIADDKGLGTILNDDAQPAISINDASANEGNAGTTPLQFTVSLSSASSQQVTVNYATQDGTATTDDGDYAANSGVLTFAPGQTEQTIIVAVTGDTKFEPNETFSVNLSGPTNATIGDGLGQGTITNDDTQPTISINDVSANEGNSGTTPFTFTVTLSNPSSGAVTVSYATTDGTAKVADTDYAAVSGTATFAPGVTSQQITVNANGDTRFEANETFTVDLSGPVNATVADGHGVGTIVNDDAQPTIAIADLTKAEGNSGATAFGFTVTLSNQSSEAVTVSYATQDGTAKLADLDYQATTGVVTFAPGVTAQTVTVQVNGDLKFEADETFTVSLSDATNATIAEGEGVGQGTITNDDTQPTISIGDVSANEGNAATTPFTFTATLSQPSSQTVTVGFATANGSATIADLDYATNGGTLTFLPGETQKTVAVQVNGDTKFEANETFSVDLSAPVNATIADGHGVGTIVNDDAQPSIAIGDVTKAEGNSGTTAFDFTVSLSNASSQTVTVNYATIDASATVADGDYTAAASTLTFAPGQTQKTVSVQVNGDTKFEPNESFTVKLSLATNATIADDVGQGTITNDDAQPAISINDVSVAEGNAGTTGATFTVSLSNASNQAVTVSYATADGTATTADGDYLPIASGTLTIPAGSTSGTVTVTVNGDTKHEPDETFVVNLGSPVNATIGDGQGRGTITNDDAAPAISITDVSANEGNSGTTPFTFTVTLSNPSAQTVTVAFATANGSAMIADLDYAPNSGTLTFLPTETSKTLTVQGNGDTKFESDENFVVNLSAPTNATVADNQGVGTIVNDDVQPTISIADVSANEGNSGPTAFTFTVTLSNASAQAVTVDYATADGTAKVADADYAAASGTATFAPGVTSQQITVNANGDTRDEPDETFVVNLSGATNATISDGQGQGTIVDDDAAPTISINDVSVAEGNAGTTPATFTVTLSAASGQTVTVGYATADGTATTAGDYVAANGTVTFLPGETSKDIAVQVTGDLSDEPNETFFVNLSTPVNATIADNQGVGTIIDDDETLPGKVTGGGQSPVGSDGNASFGLVAQRKTTGGPLSGQLEYYNHGEKKNLHSTRITRLDIDRTTNTAYVDGDCTLNGAACTFELVVQDKNEPGTTDTFTIKVNGDVIGQGGTLLKGNIQVHK